MWTHPPTVCCVNPFHKDLDNLLNTDVFLFGIKPFPIATSHNRVFLQLDYPQHLTNHMPASPDGFLGFPFGSDNNM